ncbi:MAG: hypothetical protein ABWW70_07110 [Thermoproteota archaeon]
MALQKVRGLQALRIRVSKNIMEELTETVPGDDGKRPIFMQC